VVDITKKNKNPSLASLSSKICTLFHIFFIVKTYGYLDTGRFWHNAKFAKTVFLTTCIY